MLYKHLLCDLCPRFALIACIALYFPSLPWETQYVVSECVPVCRCLQDCSSSTSWSAGHRLYNKMMPFCV